MFDTQRSCMVKEQIISRGIHEKRIIDAFMKIERHFFVPEALFSQAYGDFPLPIGNGQTISQPYMVAIMTKLLDVKDEDSVLEIGTGSGYQTAILCLLAKKVYSIEREKELSYQASLNLRKTDIRNFILLVGDGTLGWNKYAPYDKIIVTAGAPCVPESLLEQLKVNGRIVIPVGDRHSQELLILDKLDNNELRENKTCPCRFVPLVGKEGWED
ncbi:MAG: protein-L-isoaspartate(D-aspartate) O-methyltransferase [Candidatus Coatesbacteria bacterium]|nr:protein-L-isoaspartate(D-aspartate) O-methyltransferase [Candidatus Coatesbacteria bacterium]